MPPIQYFHHSMSLRSADRHEANHLAVPRGLDCCWLPRWPDAGRLRGMQTPSRSGAEKRAQERLELIFAGNLGDAYEYLSPGYRSGIHRWTGNAPSCPAACNGSLEQVTASECAEDGCKVSITIDLCVYGALPGASTDDQAGRYLRKLDPEWRRSGISFLEICCQKNCHLQSFVVILPRNCA